MPDAKDWSDVPALMDEWVEKCAAPAAALRPAFASLYSRKGLHVYWNPLTEKAAMHGQGTRREFAWCKLAIDRALGLGSYHGRIGAQRLAVEPWVKVAHSPALHTAGQVLNFLPGEPGGIPNSPSPLAATLTGGLLGAGLGYGVGWLGEQALPESWRKKRLRRSLATLGGLLGAAPGAAWSASVAQRGMGLTDGSDTAPLTDRELGHELNEADLPPFKQALDQVPVGQRYRQAAEAFAKRAFDMDTYGRPDDPNPRTAIDVNLNTLGQTLWEVGASPKDTAATMGALYAAQQLPDQRAQPGLVTPHQVGLLGTMLGASGGGMRGYAMGYLAGTALGILTGADEKTQNSLKNTGAVLGIVNAVVPRLFH